MERIRMIELSIAGARKVYHGSYIEDRILLIDEFANLPLPEEPRRAKCIVLGLCLHGKAQYSVDTEDHNVRANDAILISEGQIIDNYMLSPDFSGIGILISADFFSEIIKGVHELSSLFLFSRTHPVFSLNNEEVETIKMYFMAIKQKVDDVGHHFRTDVVRSIMMTMIYDLSNAIYRLQTNNDKRQTRAEAIFTSFIQLVERNFRVERRVGWYAEQLCITPKYLSETVKQVSRRTPNEWIDNYVTLEVRVLLKNSTMSIKEIAQTLNFPNQSFLGKFFKEHVGMSPSDYRKN
jgi:AraC-like DNA-binding protein